MKRVLNLSLVQLWTVALTALLLSLSSCNMDQPMEESNYKKENDAFIEKAVEKGYTESNFLNTNYHIYYKVLESSKEQNPSYPYQESTVKMELSGRFISGEIFQEKGEITSPVNKLVLGVQYALQMMNVGDHWEVVVPYQLGYGAYTQYNKIPGYSTLIFDIKLLEIPVQ